MLEGWFRARRFDGASRQVSLISMRTLLSCCLPLLLLLGACEETKPVEASLNKLKKAPEQEVEPLEKKATPAAEPGRQASDDPAHRGLAWRLEDGERHLYLLGSIHVGTPELYPLPRAIFDAFLDSQSLILELDLDEAASPASQRLFLAKGLFAEDDSLDRHLSPNTRALLVKHRADLGPLTAAHQRMKPWFLSSALALQSLEAHGFKTEQGIDQHFSQWAKERKIPIVALETVDGQSDALAGLSDAVQELMLRESLESLADAQKEMSALLGSWQAGDPKQIEELLMESFAQPEFLPAYQALIVKRNEEMKKAIDEYLKSPEVEFIVIGAAHLVGKDGLVGSLAEGERQITPL